MEPNQTKIRRELDEIASDASTPVVKLAERLDQIGHMLATCSNRNSKNILMLLREVSRMRTKLDV